VRSEKRGEGSTREYPESSLLMSSGGYTYEMKALVFYTIVIGFGSGILARSFTAVGSGEMILVLLLASALLILGYARNRPLTSTLFITSIFLLACVCGGVRLHVAESEVSPLSGEIGETRTLRGVVVREPDRRAESVHLFIRDDDTGALFLAFGDPFVEVSYGERVEVQGMLNLPEVFETDTGRVFDYPAYLKARGVREVMYRAQVLPISSEHGNSIIAGLITLKHGFMNVLEQSISEPALGLGEGILLGVKQALGGELEEVFRTVGIIHIVVLSGYNIMIVAESVMRFLGLFFFPRTRLFMGILVIILFALMVGLSATVVRASIMSMLVLVARTFGRTYAILRALSLAGVLMVLINPYLLAFDPGFQLSFLATLGLILLAPELEKRMSKVPEMYGVRGYLASTVGTQLFVLPLLLFSMGTLSLVSVIANVLVLPAVPVAMLMTFLTGTLGSIVPLFGIALGFVTQGLLMYIVIVAETLSIVPLASLTVPPFPWWGMCVLMFLVVYLTYTLMKRSLVPETETVLNEYADWNIEVLTETPPGMRSIPGGVKDT
jgi:competence protein ComEC